jgi:hypothetical protein
MLLGRQEKTDCACAYEILAKAPPLRRFQCYFPPFGSLLQWWINGVLKTLIQVEI